MHSGRWWVAAVLAIATAAVPAHGLPSEPMRWDVIVPPGGSPGEGASMAHLPHQGRKFAIPDRVGGQIQPAGRPADGVARVNPE